MVKTEQINSLGFMQGRLTDLVEGKIQAFPWDNWEKEFQYASKIKLSLMEWTIDQKDLYKNPLMNLEGRKKIQNLCKKFNIQIPSLTGDCFMQAPFWKASGDNRLNLQNDFINICKNSSKLGIKFIVVPLVDNGSIKDKYEEYIVIEFMRSIQNLISKLNIKIIFEIDYFPLNVSKFIKQLDSKNFGINYDMGNSAALGFKPEEEFNYYGNRIMNVHIKDRILNGTTVELGKGNVDFELVFNLLSNIKYKGNYILQTARDKDNNHIKSIAKYKKFISTYI